MRKESHDLFGDRKGSVTIKDTIRKYLSWWPLFLASLLVCVGSGMFYSRYTVPKYLVYTSFLVKGGQNGNPHSDDLIDAALNGKKEVNLNNDIMLIRSSGLMQRTVAKKNLNISYFKKGKLLDIEIYNDAPFRLVAENVKDQQLYNFHVIAITSKGGEFLSIADQKDKSYTFYWDVPFTINGQQFKFISNGPVKPDDGEYVVQWKPIPFVAAELSSQLVVQAFDVKTSVIQLSMRTENMERGKDVLNALFAEFNLADIEERNKLSESTVQFIDERLLNISNELKGVEGNLENYQGNNELVDIKGQSSQSLANSNDVSKTIKDLTIQQGIVGMIAAYFASPVNSNKLVPSSLGLNDATLASLITQYNELQLKKEREAPLVAPNSTVMQDLNTQLNNLKGSILQSLANLNQNLKLQEGSFRQQNSQYRNFLSAVPRNERVLQEIKRKQSITEGLYLYLLQKREEAAISSTSSNVPYYKQIDVAQGYGPVEPNKRNILLYAALLGFCLAFGFVYLRELFNDKVDSRHDITSNLSIPIIGEISHVRKSKLPLVTLIKRDLVGEQFRAIRTNLLFSDNQPKVILITSSVSNEGKSFVSFNLASVLAIPGKKVALLEFDLRKPTIASSLNIVGNKGLSSYIMGSTNLEEIKHPTPNIPTLHVYPSGPVPPNPADLLLNDNIEMLFNELKESYDYIVIDTAPAALVSDAFILGNYSDTVLYIVRQKFTTKKDLSFLKDITIDRKFAQLGLILNGVKKEERYGQYYEPNARRYKTVAEVEAQSTLNSYHVKL